MKRKIGRAGNSMGVRRSLALAGFLTLLGGVAHAAEDPLFADDSVLAITLTGPFQALARDRSDEPEYVPGTLSLADGQGGVESFDIRIRPRGKSRRDRKVCRFPPLRVNFKKKAVADTVFDGQNALKLVTHCQSSGNFQRYVLKEYLVYRMLNRLTDVSFRVRLLQVTYDDSENDREPFTRYGFFIEHKNRLAARTGFEVAEPDRISPRDHEPQHAAIVELFQYMVSNTDFSFIAAPPGESCCHNAVLFSNAAGQYLPVPFDFDRTGFVNPPNALPDENLGQRSVRDRLYRGFCRDDAVFDAAIEKTLAERVAITALVDDQQDLENREAQKALRFLDGYYKDIDGTRARERNLKCRSLPPASRG